MIVAAFARTWTDTDGRSIEADLIRKEADAVILKAADGYEYRISLDRLSEASKKLVADLAATSDTAKKAEILPLGQAMSASLWNPLSAPANKVAEANQLLAKADSLGGANSVTVLGDNGVLINGVSLDGLGVVRPGIFRARAAELLAEDAIASASIKNLKPALDIWDQLGDWNTPVAYLRQAAQRKGAENSDFSLFCKVALVRCYLRQGDQVSALGLLQPYAALPTTSEMIGRLQATYAEQLLKQGQLDAAAKLAIQVRDNCPIKELEYDSANVNAQAVAVLSRLPAANTGGSVSASSAETQLLTNIEANPRGYFSLGYVAYGSKNLPKAIQYWGEFLKRFPSENEARTVCLRIAQAYGELGDTEKALKAYSDTWARYADFQEGWTARLEASALQQKTGNLKEAMAILQEGETRGHASAGIAQMIAGEARLYIKMGESDMAAQKYITLLSKYGDQDAAQNAWGELKKNSDHIKNWRSFTQLVQDWLIGKDGRASGAYGGATMSVAARSDLRRMALSFYIQNSLGNEAVNWLKAVGYKSDPRERDWVIRDEAWLYAQMAGLTLRNLPKMNSSQVSQSITLGLTGWRLAPSYREGYDGLEGAYRLAASGRAPDVRTKDVIKELEGQLQSTNQKQVTQMLITLYEATGNTKSADQLRRN